MAFPAKGILICGINQGDHPHQRIHDLDVHPSQRRQRQVRGPLSPSAVAAHTQCRHTGRATDHGCSSAGGSSPGDPGGSTRRQHALSHLTHPCPSTAKLARSRESAADEPGPAPQLRQALLQHRSEHPMDPRQTTQRPACSHTSPPQQNRPRADPTPLRLPWHPRRGSFQSRTRQPRTSWMPLRDQNQTGTILTLRRLRNAMRPGHPAADLHKMRRSALPQVRMGNSYVPGRPRLHTTPP